MRPEERVRAEAQEWTVESALMEAMEAMEASVEPAALRLPR